MTIEQEFRDHYPYPGGDPVARLRHVLAIYDDRYARPDQWAITATQGVYTVDGEPVRTGLTYGDLAALAELAELADAGSDGYGQIFRLLSVSTRGSMVLALTALSTIRGALDGAANRPDPPADWRLTEGPDSRRAFPGIASQRLKSAIELLTALACGPDATSIKARSDANDEIYREARARAAGGDR